MDLGRNVQKYLREDGSFRPLLGDTQMTPALLADAWRMVRFLREHVAGMFTARILDPNHEIEISSRREHPGVSFKGEPLVRAGTLALLHKEAMGHRFEVVKWHENPYLWKREERDRDQEKSTSPGPLGKDSGRRRCWEGLWKQFWRGEIGTQMAAEKEQAQEGAKPEKKLHLSARNQRLGSMAKRNPGRSARSSPRIPPASDSSEQIYTARDLGLYPRGFLPHAWVLSASTLGRECPRVRHDNHSAGPCGNRPAYVAARNSTASPTYNCCQPSDQLLLQQEGKDVSVCSAVAEGDEDGLLCGRAVAGSGFSEKNHDFRLAFVVRGQAPDELEGAVATANGDQRIVDVFAVFSSDEEELRDASSCTPAGRSSSADHYHTSEQHPRRIQILEYVFEKALPNAAGRWGAAARRGRRAARQLAAERAAEASEPQPAASDTWRCTSVVVFLDGVHENYFSLKAAPERDATI
eukprot:g12965.t1